MTEYKETAMFNKKVFISFDYDNDKDIKENLVAQTRQSFCSYEIRDASIKASIDSKWKEEARQRIKNCDVVIVLCGEHTDTASGVTAELTIAQKEHIPYFLLQGRRGKECLDPFDSVLCTSLRVTQCTHGMTQGKAGARGIPPPFLS